MITPRKFVVVQRALLLGVLLAALYFVLVYLKISHDTSTLDARLTSLWQQLEQAQIAAAPGSGVDLSAMDSRQRRVETISARLRAAEAKITNRMAFDAQTRKKMQMPFQLFEFQNERQTQIETLGKMMAEKKVAAAPTLFAGLPDYSSEIKQPGLLWGQLALAREVLDSALQCQIASIRSLSSAMPRPVTPEELPPAQSDELAVTIEVEGSSAAVRRFLLCLTLKPDEAGAMGLPAVSATKPAFFVDRILMRNVQPNKPAAVRLELRISTLVFRNGP